MRGAKTAGNRRAGKRRGDFEVMLQKFADMLQKGGNC